MKLTLGLVYEKRNQRWQKPWISVIETVPWSESHPLSLWGRRNNYQLCFPSVRIIFKHLGYVATSLSEVGRRDFALTHQGIKMSVARLQQQRTYMLVTNFMTHMKTFIIVYSLLPFMYSLSDGNTQIPAGQNLSLILLHRYWNPTLHEFRMIPDTSIFAFVYSAFSVNTFRRSPLNNSTPRSPLLWCHCGELVVRRLRKSSVLSVAWCNPVFNECPYWFSWFESRTVASRTSTWSCFAKDYQRFSI